VAQSVRKQPFDQIRSPGYHYVEKYWKDAASPYLLKDPVAAQIPGGQGDHRYVHEVCRCKGRDDARTACSTAPTIEQNCITHQIHAA
jgi:hypothetical protein